MKTRSGMIVWAFFFLVLGFVAGFFFARDGSDPIAASGRHSLVHFPFESDMSPEMVDAAEYIMDYLTSGDRKALQEALKICRERESLEEVGGASGAFGWLCDYLLANREGQARFLQDQTSRRFVEFYTANDNFALKVYLSSVLKRPLGSLRKGRLPGDIPLGNIDTDVFLDDFLQQNNPGREQWEQTTRTIAALGLKEGMHIADIGCGSGYHTFLFSPLVGDSGVVDALDTNPAHIRYLKWAISKAGVHNIIPRQSKPNDVALEVNSLDYAFLCSMYHAIYVCMKEEDFSAFLDSILKALKPDGTLVVVDNAQLVKGERRYVGGRIARELVIRQLEAYGLKLVKEQQFIPQRYILFFKKK